MTGAGWHLVFESAAYLVGGQTFWWLSRRKGDAVEAPTRWLVIGGAIFGAAIGAWWRQIISTSSCSLPWRIAASAGPRWAGCPVFLTRGFLEHMPDRRILRAIGV